MTAPADPASVVLAIAVAALLALPLLRRLARAGRRPGGGAARLLLALSAFLALGAAAAGTMGGASFGNLLQLAALLALTLGLVATGGLVVFDVVLPRLRIELPSIVRDLVVAGIAVGLGVGFLRLAGLDLFSLVTTSAVLTAVVGIALQSTIANVFGGLGLQLDRTLRRGEWIEVGGRVGRILEIGWRSTRIETKDGGVVHVPNGELITKDVHSFGRTGGQRMTMRVGFHHRHPPNDVRRVLVAAIRDVPGVADLPAPECGPVEFGESAVVYALRYTITDFARDDDIADEVHARVWYAARRAGLEMPAPIRTLVFERAADERPDDGELLRRLETTAPFDRLDAARRRRCTRGARRLEFGRGERITDDAEDGLYVVEHGEVAVQLPHHGDMLLATGEPFGRAVLPGPHVCTAASDVVVHRLDERAVRHADAALAPALAAIGDARRSAMEARRPADVPATSRAGGLARLFARAGSAAG